MQTVTYHVLSDFQGYTTQYNIGANRRGTAIVARDGINPENIILIPSGRAMAAKFREIWVINLYAPCILYIGQTCRSSTEYAFYIFSQQIYLIFF